ncbi:MAG: hypothetical protein Q8S96_15155 [Hydrogenophaga sp.]|nr:hypothetical protein [Hydrogenophaga sp.]MDP3345773.1 hypothetical protein [Hydrogenophaga sp.]MDP3805594.1 hypothetical protein [Hydrogenophaga sp.]
MPLIFLGWVVLGWLQIVAADSGTGGEFFNGLLKQAVKTGNAHSCASVRRVQLCVDALKSAVDGFGLKIHGCTDHFAAVSCGLTAQKVQVGFCEARAPEQFLTHGYCNRVMQLHGKRARQYPGPRVAFALEPFGVS